MKVISAMNVSAMTTAHPASVPEDELAPTRRSLLERLRDLDDHVAWQEFFDIYWKLLYCAAIKSGLSDTEAEEVVQEAIIGVARRMEEFRYDPQICSFKGWLMHVTRRRIIDRLRKRQTHPQIFTPLKSDTATSGTALQISDACAQDAFEGMWNEEWKKNLVDAAIERAKRVVRSEHYQIFHLHYIKQMPARDVARMLRVSTAKVYVVCHRVTRMVKNEMQDLEKKHPW